MKLAAIVTPYLPSEVSGGVERFNYYLENFLCRNGYEVHYYHSGTIKQDKLNNLRYINSVVKPLRTGKQIKNIKDYSLVISNGNYGIGIKRKKGVKYINFHHGTSMGLADAVSSKYSWKSFLINKYLTLGPSEFLSGMKMSRVAVGQCVRDELRRYFNSDSYLLCNAVDTKHFKKLLSASSDTIEAKTEEAKRELNCLFISRYDRYLKGFDFLEKLIEKLEGVRWTIIISGSHSLKKRWNTDIYENINYFDLPAYYSRADVAFYLSRYEGNSYYLLEALCSELPVIATPAGEAKHIYKCEELDRLLIKTSIDEAEAFDEVKSIVEYLRDKSVRDKAGRASRRIIENSYSMQRWETELKEILSKI